MTIIEGQIQKVESSMEFHPFDDPFPPTQQTDLFLFGGIVYELMTGYWPLTPEALSGRYTSRELAARVVGKEWPRLEAEHMGTIVHRCWNGDFASAEEVRSAVRAFLEGLGWEIEGDDDLKASVPRICSPRSTTSSCSRVGRDVDLRQYELARRVLLYWYDTGQIHVLCFTGYKETNGNQTAMTQESTTLNVPPHYSNASYPPPIGPHTLTKR
jgi:hypothetical protein